jgi:hypothetical protein
MSNKSLESKLIKVKADLEKRIKGIERVIAVSKQDISFFLWLQENLIKEKQLINS